MKEIKDYIHHYLGASVMFPVFGPETIYILLGVVDVLACVRNAKGAISCDISDIKLLLRPLSDMTEEEARKFLKLDGIDATNVAITNYGILHDNTEWGFNPIGHGMPATPHQFMFLLSKGFDLFNLIESGLAINKTTLKEKI